ncbi:MAG TPA: signal peptidase II [Gaiellaceae bacterium]|jgi:lipoprotein signal peptidase
MRQRRWLAVAAAGLVLAADLSDSAAARTVYFHPRPLWLLAAGATAAAAILVLAPRIPSLTLSLGAGTAAGGALATFVAALVWSRGVPDPLVRGSVAFNLADVAIAAGVALLLASALLVAWQRRHQLRHPV